MWGGGVDLVEIGGGEEGDEDLAIAAYGEVLDPRLGRKFVDNFDGQGKRLFGSGGGGEGVAGVGSDVRDDGE